MLVIPENSLASEGTTRRGHLETLPEQARAEEAWGSEEGSFLNAMFSNRMI